MIDPIIYIISAIATETVKDVSKHIGKKAKETYDTLHEPIIQLGINDYYNSQEIQQKLEAKPEIKLEIERKIADNQDVFAKLLPILREKFNNYSKTNKNNANLTISEVKGSTITTNIHQNNEKVFTNHLLIIVAIVAIVGIVSISLFAFIQNVEKSNNQNSSTNSNTNSQTNVTLPNTNILSNNSNVNPLNANGIVNNSNKGGVKPSTNKPVTNPPKPKRQEKPSPKPTPRNI
jgi:hypothetical protein